MYNVSEGFLNAIRSPSRRVCAKAVIDYTSPFLDESINITVNDEARASLKSQIADALINPTKKYAALDGSWVLDGTYSLAPASPDNGEIGWWSASLSDANGLFATKPMLTVTFVSRPIDSLKVVGDSQRGEYPVNFVIKLYSGNALVYTETVTNNTLLSWSKLIESITQITKMTLEISKWSHPGRCVKILEFFTSIQQSYEESDIISIDLLEEREVSQGSLPVGNISSNELKIVLNNADRRFDAGNTESPLYNLLKPNRRIKAYMGAEISLNWEVYRGKKWSDL